MLGGYTYSVLFFSKLAEKNLLRLEKISKCRENMASLVYEGKIAATSLIGNLSKPRRQRERRQTKGLMSNTIAVHVRYKSLYISLPFSAKQQREMTKFCVF